MRNSQRASSYALEPAALSCCLLFCAHIKETALSSHSHFRLKLSLLQLLHSLQLSLETAFATALRSLHFLHSLLASITRSLTVAHVIHGSRFHSLSSLFFSSTLVWRPWRASSFTSLSHSLSIVHSLPLFVTCLTSRRASPFSSLLVTFFPLLLLLRLEPVLLSIASNHSPVTYTLHHLHNVGQPLWPVDCA